MTTAQPVRLKTIVFPIEHGGWGFLFEPIVLALSVAPSLAGLCLSLSAISLFLLRHPLKLVLKSRERASRSRRDIVAGRVASIYAAVAALGLVATVLLAGLRSMFPFVVLSPLIGVFLFYDRKNQSRNLVAELAAPLSLAGVAPAVAVAGGWGGFEAAALWIILMARTIPSIFYVRARLRLERGKPFARLPVLLQHAAALGVGAWLVSKGGAPVLTLVALGVLLLRAIVGLSRYRRFTRAKQVGFAEIGFGLFYVIATVVGFKLGL